MIRTPRRASSPHRPTLAGFAAGLLAGLLVTGALAPGAAAQPALSLDFAPAAPVAGDVVVVTLRQEGVDCTVGVDDVQPFAGGVRLRLRGPISLPDLSGDPGTWECVSFDGPTTAFLVREPGPFEIELVDGGGEPVASQTLGVGDGEPWFEEADPLHVEVARGPRQAFRFAAEGLWPHGGTPRLGRVEWRGPVIEVHLLGFGSGPSAITPWQLRGQLPGALGGFSVANLPLFAVAFYTDEPGFTGPRRVAYVRLPYCFGAGDDDPQLCLQDGRFRVRAWYRLAGGEEQRAQARELTADSGSFWFFREDNVELVVKVLDGCAAFDHWWVFAAGLTNVGVRIEVTDTRNGETWSHVTEPGEGFDEVRDTAAFAICP